MTEDSLPRRADGAEGPTTTKVLVVYGTKSGCTAGVAERIGVALERAGMAADVLPAHDGPDPRDYDGVVAGSGVRAGRWHRAVTEWVAENAAALRAMPTALYTVCLTLVTDPGKADEVRAYTDALLAESGIEPIDIGLFGGWFEPQRFGLVERTVLKAMKAPRGDHRDWDAIDRWVAGVAPGLKS
ncbi:MAG TPA: flavodoxin domain-containing protein [Coriobacteriia bacterium]|nr:flavodoxin domain-containing protein [Coriobacteriia bacterium]